MNNAGCKLSMMSHYPMSSLIKNQNAAMGKFVRPDVMNDEFQVSL